MQVYFQNLALIIEESLRQARQEILIAVCWLSHPGIFETILAQCRRGIQVTLIVNYDQLNIQPEGKPDFQAFIRAGGRFYGYTQPELMHHKFCIIDRQFLLNGSFNWTLNNNRENIVVTQQAELVQAFLREFEALLAAARYFKQIDYGLVKTFQSLHLLAAAEYSEQALRKKITRGAQAWIYHVGKDKIISNEMLRAGIIGFRNKQLMTRFWEQRPYFDKNYFLDFIKTNKATAIEKAVCRAWCLRLKQGDLVVSCDRLQGIITSLGIVQSVPLLFGRFHTGRQVAWIKDFGQLPLVAGFEIPSAGLSVYRGSSLELVARLCS